MTELRGEQVVLTPTTAEDGPALRAIHAAEEVARWWDDPEPGFPDLDDDELERFTIRHRGEIAGMIQVYEETEPEVPLRRARPLRRPEHQGQGVGTEAIRLLLEELLKRPPATTGSRSTRRLTTPRR